MSSVGQIGVVVTEQPEDEPITLAEAKLHLRVVHNEEDTHITSLIRAARTSLEKIAGRAFVTQTLRASYEDFPRPATTTGISPWSSWPGTPMPQRSGPVPVFELPRSPADPEGTLEIKYLDDDEVERTLDPATYILDADAEPSRIRAKLGQCWPIICRRPAAVRITYQAGVPVENLGEDIKHVVKLVVGALYELRETEVTGIVVAQVKGLQRFIDRIRIPFPQ